MTARKQVALRKQNLGLTLIELVIVLTILVALAGKNIDPREMSMRDEK